jgi:hypothetical protein
VRWRGVRPTTFRIAVRGRVEAGEEGLLTDWTGLGRQFTIDDR